MIDPPDHIPDLHRLKAFYAAILFLFAIIVARLWYLQIVKGPELSDLAETQRTRLIRRVAARGAILDARGHVLATSRFHWVVSVVPDELRQDPEILPRLAQILAIKEQTLSDTIKEERSRTMPFDPIPVATDVDVHVLTEIEEQRLDLPGVLITEDPVRYYVDDQLCTHLLGVTRPISKEKLDTLGSQGYHGGDYVGVEGLEAVYEADLRGTDGGEEIAVDARGRMQHSVREFKPTSGRSLRLALDLGLQKAAYEGLQEELKRGHPGAAVALDPNDGAVLAFVSTPSYDLNRYGVDYGKLLADPLKPLINRASGSRYPCGSTFKLITAAAGLETGAITPYSTDYCSGAMRVGNRVFHCDKRSGHGSLGFERAIGASCDIYFWHVAQRVGTDALVKWAYQYGLGARTGIDLPVDSKGLVPTPAWKKRHKLGPWVPGDLLNMAIGQGFVGVTPLQLADYTAALANGGSLMRPQLVREIVDTSNGQARVVRRLQPQARGKLDLKPAYRDAIVAGMTRVLERGGTAYGLGIPGLSIAAKTGTAEAYVHGRKTSHSVFVCFAPVEHPKIAIAVLVEGGGFGSDAAAPIARRMLLRYFGIHGDVGYAPIGAHYGSD